MRGYEFHIKEKNGTLRAGFEPARGDPIGFQVQRLNHSAITATRFSNFDVCLKVNRTIPDIK